jgi:hypothetical protein
MWEAKAAEGRTDELLAWVLEHAAPHAQVYRSADARVVVIDDSNAGLPEAPAELLDRPAHAWRFTPVPR